MTYILRHLPELLAGAVGMALLVILRHWALGTAPVRGSVARGRAVNAISVAVTLLLAFGQIIRPARIAIHLPVTLRNVVGTAWLLVVISLVTAAALVLVLRLTPRSHSHHSPARRRVLLAARGAVLASPVAAAGYAVFIQRSDFSVKETSLPIAGLPPELNGLRIVQLSDIHLSPFLSERELARAVDMANELRGHLALVTGDLITTSKDPIDRCIRQLARLKADAGVLACMGNHETYAGVEDIAEELGGQAGMEFLRSSTRILKFRGKPVNFAGVDYQPLGTPYLVGAQSMIEPGMPNILLSHNPDVFPVAAEMGYDATISGHTHGGQISVEILRQNLSMARFYTPYVYGLYRKGISSIYVTRGIGTVGVPARLGAPPEIALIRLCAT